MKSRKTIEVEKVRELANHFLCNSPDKFTSERHGVASLLESVLHETGNYKGFGYLCHPWQKDESRRHYY